MRLFQGWLRALPGLIALLFAAALGGCGATEGEGSGAPGTLGVSLTDAPACGFDAVNVTIKAVRVHQSTTASDTDSGWTTITLNPSRKINLLDLTNGVLETLGETPLAPGHYTQLRLMLEPNTGMGLANSVVPTGGVETALATPSAVQSGIKLVHGFDVASGERVDVVLDFDACRSVVLLGNGGHLLKPVIKVSPLVLNGITGFVDSALLGSVMVTAQQNGEIFQTTAPRSDGYFLLARLAPGSYDVVFTADGRATAVITGVPVATETTIVDVSTSGAPIALPPSAMQKVSGTATLNPESPGTDVTVAAKQTFGASPTVTVKSTIADETAGGAYALVLPSGAPQLGAYSTPLPIVFAAQAALAGQYAVAASAAGYMAQSANVDISAADATQNFVLVP